MISGNLTINRFTARYATESLANIERITNLFRNLGVEDYARKQTGKLYIIKFSKNLNIPGFEFVYENAVIAPKYKKEIQTKESLEKSVIRGLFLGSGSVNNSSNAKSNKGISSIE